LTRLTLGTALSRAWRLHCPRCGGGLLFKGWFTMHEECPVCGLRYERAPGYFLGSAYINYGVTAVVLTFLYVVLHFGAEFTNRQLAAPLAIFCVIFPLWLFRRARAWWLAMDLYFDASGSGHEEADRRDDPGRD
jgi:uncharacterized protein (DUF983 family)